MENVKIEVKGKLAIITIDLSHRGGLTASGRNIKVASTGGGNAAIGDTGVKLNLNAYTAA